MQRIFSSYFISCKKYEICYFVARTEKMLVTNKCYQTFPPSQQNIFGINNSGWIGLTVNVHQIG